MRRACLPGGLQLGAMAGLLLSVAGCLKPHVRSQSDEEPQEQRYTARTVGDVTSFANADPLPVIGVGLVTGLNGTGSAPRKGSLRATLEKDLKTMGVRKMDGILNSKSTAMVVVSAEIKPGARKGDKVDLIVQLPRGSRATSLRGGRLQHCYLYTHERAGNLSSRYADSDIVIKGRKIVVAEGNVLVGFGGGNEAERLKEGRIWGGGVSKVGRPFHLVMDPDQQQAYLTSLVADRINGTFYDDLDGSPKEIAHAKNHVLIFLTVPPQYKRNLRRYLRVVRAIPLSENEQVATDEAPRQPYRSQLREDLLDPALTVKAALRLEALGRPSIPILKEGLESKDPLVRFCSAEALAYLGNSAAGDELASVVRHQPYLRAFALTALSSLDEGITNVKLRELLVRDHDVETRYGAFRALRAVNDRDPLVEGLELNGEFSVHYVSDSGDPVVHVSMKRRPEIVFFGATPKLQPPFSLLAGKFVVTAAEGDDACTVSRYDLQPKATDQTVAPESTGVSRARVPLELPSILVKMARQGASYTEVVELIRQAEAIKSLTCHVRFDALPQAISVRDLVNAGKARKKLLENKENVSAEVLANAEIIRPVGDDFAIPTSVAATPADDFDAKAELLRKSRNKPKGERTAKRRD